MVIASAHAVASSRSEDGKDDSGIFYLDIIKSLSSGQLKMHYLIYRILNNAVIINAQKKFVNPAQQDDLVKEKIFFVLSADVLSQFKKEDLAAILHGLRAKDLIHYFQTTFKAFGIISSLRNYITSIRIYIVCN